eukprot:CAMPEP_0172528306 /NCGR_PEP_ID=MMETSP1067-20121228/2740_1 /TAXON_ID=265564 ORGANISM="Thalassiosira punctigera, Strain Tpunct2005C2" /NCGR_SAMPLE_ID=MMETSP1067 /ASSEMBLY_ACC=CAM_ASM_000444 /LENGTH=167 /DNA_ID=CAMNT_0013312193 /DNA_START=432 /DNA_END=936 /DNA_ORIENTATION=-
MPMAAGAWRIGAEVRRDCANYSLSHRDSLQNNDGLEIDNERGQPCGPASGPASSVVSAVPRAGPGSSFQLPFVPDVSPHHRCAVPAPLVEGRARLTVLPLKEAAPHLSHRGDDALGDAKLFILEAGRVDLLVQADDLAVGKVARVFQSDALAAAYDVIVIDLRDPFG